jgi:hypothetical protein
LQARPRQAADATVKIAEHAVGRRRVEHGRACVKLFVKLCVKLWMTFEAQLDAGAARRILS